MLDGREGLALKLLLEGAELEGRPTDEAPPRLEVPTLLRPEDDPRELLLPILLRPDDDPRELLLPILLRLEDDPRELPLLTLLREELLNELPRLEEEERELLLERLDDTDDECELPPREPPPPRPCASTGATSTRAPIKRIAANLFVFISFPFFMRVIILFCLLQKYYETYK